MTPVERTRAWITQVVIGCNFCPFAAREVNNDTIHYEVCSEPSLALETFQRECLRLDQDASIETTFLIFPQSFESLDAYLDLVDQAERQLRLQGYEGVYQVASFHPLYRFADSDRDDPANYTNRSIYPMLHLLREASVEEALDRWPDPAAIPARNVAFARSKGLQYMQGLRDQC